MKRSPMPRRKKPLARVPIATTGGSKPGSPLARTPIRPQSAKRRRDNKLRKAALIAAYGPNPPCHVRWDERCRGMADAGHELLKRSRGGSITDPSNAVPCCDPCNSAIEDYPAEAHRRGWAKHSWEDAA